MKKKVRIGDPVTLVQQFDEIGQCVSGKCLDNRVAAFVAIEALRKTKNLKYELVLGCTVQEEVGLRGAGPAAYTAEPDIAIGIDTTLAVDIPGVPEDERFRHFSDEARVVVSEPLVDLPGLWEEIPPSTALVVQDGDDVVTPFRPRPPS